MWGRVKRLEWSDITTEAREAATRATMRRVSLSRHDAEDIVANAIVRLMHTRPFVRSPIGLLTMASVNLAITERRIHAGRPTICELSELVESSRLEEPSDPNSDHVTQIIDKEERASQAFRLHTYLDQLSPVDKSILLAHYIEGRSLKSIDEERGDKQGTANVRLHRARQRLAKLIDVATTPSGRER